ncbi:hypothetical protein B0H34DRAFT_686326 [Crassisporium funariophilum]|nr:hypothetical protein B0H34DRAFT_686326 [Crassisporium funariophilum]
MSRIPQPSSSRPSIKPPSTPGKSRVAPASTPVRVRTKSTARSATPAQQRDVEIPPPTPGNALSIKDAIAMRRAEAKRAQSKPGGDGLDNLASLEDALPDVVANKEDDDILGRLPVRETIEQARSTGSLNLATRSLPCIPSALFEIHLGVTPESLKSVPNEPALPPAELKVTSRRGGRDQPAWFEAQDLTVLKAWNNDIEEVQHEISMFGSLKTIDLHKNKLASLPNTFADLTALTVLDLSHNFLTKLPDNLFALPELTTLNLSHNLLTGLPFNAPFASGDGRSRSNQYTSGIFFTPAVSRASTSLPHLVVLDASHNRIKASAIDDYIPVSLSKLDLSANPLGHSQKLLRNLSTLKRLRDLKFEKAEIGDDSFPRSLFSEAPFPTLRLLDLSETQANLDVVKEALKRMKQELNYDFTSDDPPEGVTRVLVGKKVMKEYWELEAERRANARNAATLSFGDDWAEPPPIQHATSRTSAASPTPTSKPGTKPVGKPAKPASEVVKEAWEIQAEQGLLTEGGRRRARAAAAAAAQAEPQVKLGVGIPPPSSRASSPSPAPPSPGASLNTPQYFTQSSQTLRLPASAPPTKSPGHARAFSLAAPSLTSFPSAGNRSGDLSVPTPTLPLSVIVTQPFANTLRVLILANRRADRSFTLPNPSENVGGFLPCLEELDLEGCNLSDFVMVYPASEQSSGSTTPPRTNELVLPTLAKLFPSLRTLNLSYNGLTNASLTSEALSTLILTSPHRKGLRHLRLRGNRLSEMDGFLSLAEGFKGNRDVPGWKLEEIDVRDNEINKLPPELGLLPLDVFLVDGNTFRVPQRRVWEREGTKGLLSWLRGRIE